MDPFLAGTGSLGVISLAFQIAEGVNKLSSFLKSISEAPKEIEAILEDLNFFNTLLTRIQENDELHGRDALTNEALQKCKKSVDALTEIVYSLVPGFASQSNIKRKWTGVEAVMKTEKILKVKTSLQEAKLDLIAAQIVSFERTSHRHHHSLHESLLPIPQMQQQITEVHEMLSFQSRTVTIPGPNVQASNPVQSLSPDIQRASETWSPEQFRPVFEAELSKAVQACVENMQQERRDHVSHESVFAQRSISTQVPALLKFSGSLVRRKRQLGIGKSRTTRTIMGTINCIVSQYEVLQPYDLQGDGAEIEPKKQTEKKTCFIFRPSRWLVKFRANRVLQFEKIKSNARCWQTTLRTFNLVPNNAQIFRFCREGNLGAMRSLLTNGEASVDDVNEYGKTPLQVAANYTQPEKCALLLRRGADLDARDWDRRFHRKPFISACLPGNELEDETVIPSLYPPCRRWINTIRVFLSAGEEIGNATAESYILEIFKREMHMHEYRKQFIAEESSLPSKWLVGDIMPSVEPYLLDDGWWEKCGISCLDARAYHPTLVDVLKKCDILAVRRLLLYFISELRDKRPLDERKYKEFAVLVKFADGLCFLCKQWGYFTSPISLSLERGHMFSKFRQLLTGCGFDIPRLVRAEVEINDQGWKGKEKELLEVFDEDFAPFTGPDFDAAQGKCKSCLKHARLLHEEWDYPWYQRLCRIRQGIDRLASLDENERRHLEAWDVVLKDNEAGICYFCSVKRHKKMWPFSLHN